MTRTKKPTKASKTKTKLPPTPGMGARRPTRPPPPPAPLPAKEEPPKERMLKAKYNIDFNSIVFLPPLTSLEKCPRCEKPHKRIKPLKFKKPMRFWRKGDDGQMKLMDQASHWFMCKRTKEPVVLFDRVDQGLVILNTVADQAVKEICEAEDKKFLDSISTWTATYKMKPKGKGKGKGAKKVAEEMHIKASFGPTTTWVYDPNHPSRMVPASTPLGEEKVTLAAGPKPKSKRR
jgi:hypothetical protein